MESADPLVVIMLKKTNHKVYDSETTFLGCKLMTTCSQYFTPTGRAELYHKAVCIDVHGGIYHLLCLLIACRGNYKGKHGMNTRGPD